MSTSWCSTSVIFTTRHRTHAGNLAKVFERRELEGGSWIDIARGFLPDSDEVYRSLEESVPWNRGKVWRYEKWVEEPRMSAGGSRKNPHHPALLEAQGVVESEYRVRFDGFGLQYYRDARDSVAMHRDREMRWLDDTVVAISKVG